MPLPRRTFTALVAALALTLVAAACASNDDDTTTGEATAGETESSATDASTTSDAADTDEGDTDEGDTNDGDTGLSTVSFASEIQPILEDNCASCHTPSGPGAAHLQLVTAADAQRDALSIAGVVEIGYMPPWPAGDGDVPFHDDRRLDQDEIDAVRTWFQEGGQIDVDPTSPITASREVAPPLDGDLEIVGEPYKGSSANVDDYRCQIYDPELTEAAFLQRYGFEADRTEVVHHALVFAVGAEERERYEALDADDEAVGWACTGAGVASGSRDTSQIMSWAPGQAPTALPADTGIEMAADDFFVVQIHYHYEPVWDDLAPDASTLVVDFADDDVIEAAGGALDPIDLTIYLGPAEIPCAADEEGPLCDRDAARQAINERTRTLSTFVSDGLNRRCGLDPATIQPRPDSTAESMCDLPARPGEIVSVWGHMHELGAWYRMTLNPGTPDELVLLDIPTWSFEWQLNYEPTEQIVLAEDDIIRVECGWDASLRPEGLEPQWVMWAEGTNDEMCYSQIVTRPTSTTS